jgi:hypothetical protein
LSNYTQVTFFAPKDSLLHGDPNKIIHGTQVDPELAAIATAIATKFDVLNMGSIAQLAIGSGAVGAPSYAFGSDTTTGLYLSAVGTLAIAAAGVNEGKIGGGMILGAPTGGVKGVGTLNATGLYINGTAVVAGTGAGLTSANPSAVIGLSAVNGTATTFMTSDSAPALSQAIAPTWTALHTFTKAGEAIFVNSASPFIRVQDTGAAGSILELKVINLKAIINTNWTTTATPLSLQINGTEAIGIATTGAVSIAAPSSGDSLSISNAGAGQNLIALNTTSATSGRITFSNSGTPFLYIASAKSVISGAFSNTDAAFYSTGQVVISAGGASIQQFILGVNGNLTLSAPSSGTALTVNTAASALSAVFTDGTVSGFIQASSTLFGVGTSTAHRIGLWTNNIERLTINSSGAVAVNAPTSGRAFSVTAVSGQYAAAIQGAGTSGNNFGLLVSAGAGAGDTSFAVQNSAQSAVFLQILGDGHGTLGPTLTSGMQWTNAGAITLNATSGTPLTVQASGTSLFSVNGTSAPTIQGYGPTAAALVDMTPDTGTFTITYTGFTAGVTGTAIWARVGNLVTLFLPTGTGTSNTVNMSATGIPNVINPTRAQWVWGVAGQNNTLNQALSARVDAANTITFGAGAPGTVAGFTASGTKGVFAGSTIQYLLN